MPPLDHAALTRLRQLVLAARPEAGLASRVLIGHLAASVDAPRPVTVDFAATAELGLPLVVVEATCTPPPGFAELSVRELEVAGLLAAGLANKEIASRLFISVATVKDHVHRVLRKTGLASRAAVAAAWRVTDPQAGPPSARPRPPGR